MPAWRVVDPRPVSDACFVAAVASARVRLLFFFACCCDSARSSIRAFICVTLWWRSVGLASVTRTASHKRDVGEDHKSSTTAKIELPDFPGEQ
eukprot:3829628-Prymnesium_polylepis.1